MVTQEGPQHRLWPSRREWFGLGPTEAPWERPRGPGVFAQSRGRRLYAQKTGMSTHVKGRQSQEGRGTEHGATAETLVPRSF